MRLHRYGQSEPSFFAAVLWILSLFTGTLSTMVPETAAYGQQDQGSVTGAVVDATGARVSNAQVTLVDVDTGLVLQGKTGGSGVYTFSPVKIRSYKIPVTAVAEKKELDAKLKQTTTFLIESKSAESASH